MDVHIYATHDCAFSRQCIEMCAAAHIPCRVSYVDEDMALASAFIAETGQIGTPAVYIPAALSTSQRDEYVIGFQEQRLRELLASSL